MPSLSRYDLEANEVGLSAELCLREAPDSDLEQVRQQVEETFDRAADAGHELVERRVTAGVALTLEQVTALVDRLANAEQRLQDLAANASDHLEPIRFSRIQHLVSTFHQQARKRLLDLLPETDDVPTAPVARTEPVPSTSRTIGKVSKSRPRVLETAKTPDVERPEPDEILPIVKTTKPRRPPASALSDDDIVAEATRLKHELPAFISRTRADALRPSRVPADMKDLFEQQATRLEHAATAIDAAVERNKAQKLPVARLGEQLHSGAAQLRYEGNRVYGAMLMGRRPRETYLQWLVEHRQVEIVKDPRGRIKTRQRKDYFQEYRINDTTHQNKALWVAHFHYAQLTDPDEHFTAAHLKFADGYLYELPAHTRQALNTFDAVDNALRRIISPSAVDLFIKPQPPH